MESSRVSPGKKYWKHPIGFIRYAACIFLGLSTVPIVGLLKRNSRGTSLALRNGLIIGQIFIGSLFLLTSCMFYSQYRFMSRTEQRTGHRSHLADRPRIRCNLQYWLYPFYRSTKTKLSHRWRNGPDTASPCFKRRVVLQFYHSISHRGT